MKLIHNKKIRLDELFKQQYGNKFDDAVNEVSIVEVCELDENRLFLIEVDSTMTRVKFQLKTKTLKRWGYLALASGGGFAIQRVVVWFIGCF